MPQTISRHLAHDDAQRRVLHDEVLTRPSATFKLPALIVSLAALNKARPWQGGSTLMGSTRGRTLGRTLGRQSPSHLMTHLRIGAAGFERIGVLAAAETSKNRSGQKAQKFLALETYRHRLCALSAGGWFKESTEACTRVDANLHPAHSINKVCHGYK
jgi:hypothetical protein